MKRIMSLLLILMLMLSMSVVTAFGTETVGADAAETATNSKDDISQFELPTPKAPNYFVFTDGDASEAAHDDLQMIMMADPEVALLAAEYDADSDAFYEKYGLYSFEITMQYDVSLDGEDNWQYNEEWDTQYYNDGIGQGYPYNSIRSEMMEEFGFFWLTYYEGPDSDTFVPYKPAIITEKYEYSDGSEGDIYSFDVENHSLYIRCRYYMEWETFDKETNEVGEKQSKVSGWSESAIFGKNTTQIVPDEPTTYEAPIISDLKIVLSEGDENSHLEYVQTTPESVWMAGIYYIMNDDGQFDGLETQVSVDDGKWINFDTADSGDDWCLYNGSRTAYNEDYPIEEDSNVKLRVRFTGTHGPSEWSNVLELNGGGTQELTEEPKESVDEPAVTEDKDEGCSLCGFCPQPIGICIFIWIAIAAVIVIVIAAVVIKKRKNER